MQKSFVYERGTINYSIQGAGNVVVLVHGFGEDGSVFDQQVDALSGSNTVLVPDLPGSGDSTLLEGSNITIDDYATCLYKLLQHENITKCILLGHSMGGYITLAFAEKYPETLLGFGLIHSTAFADSDEKKLVRQRGIKAIEEYGATAFLKNTIPNLFSAAFKQENANAVSAFIDKGNSFSIEALVQYYHAMMNRPDRTSVLKTSSLPVLFIIGTEDTAAPLNDLLLQVHLPNISQINILQNVGHMGMLESATEINQHLKAFISLVNS